MARHVEVIKLVAKITVVPDAGKDMQQQFGRAKTNQNAHGERWKRRNPRSLVIGARRNSASDSHTRIVLLTPSASFFFPKTLFQNVFAESSRIVTGPSLTNSTCIVS